MRTGFELHDTGVGLRSFECGRLVRLVHIATIVKVVTDRRAVAGPSASVLMMVACFLLLIPMPAWGDEPLDDRHIEGYVLAILERDFNLPSGSVVVRDGHVTVVVPSLRHSERNRLVEVLGQVRGVRHVDLRPGDSPLGNQAAAAHGVPIAEAGAQWFPHGRLFEPLHADPRWPHFAATARSYTKGGEGGVNTAFAGDFGEILTLYRNHAPFGRWDIGVQGGVFSLFDIGAPSKHLINADYLIGLISSYRSGRWSMFFRYLHESSHLGDEFLLNRLARRTNVSYEMVDAKLSLDLYDGLRLYGGLGTLVRQDPATLPPVQAQYGIELQSPSTVLGGLRPIAFADFQTHQYTQPFQNQWITNVSVRAGFQFENVRVLDRRVQLLAEYYGGRSPNGQFFLQRVETIGLGLHVYF